MAKFKKGKKTAKKIYGRARSVYKRHGHLFSGALGSVVAVSVLKIVSQFIFKHKDASGKEVGFLPFGETAVMRYGILWALNKFVLSRWLKTPPILNTVLEIKFADAIVTEWGGKMIPALALGGEVETGNYGADDEDIYFDEATGQVVQVSGDGEVSAVVEKSYV